jgi:hypothetical protein
MICQEIVRRGRLVDQARIGRTARVLVLKIRSTGDSKLQFSIWRMTDRGGMQIQLQLAKGVKPHHRCAYRHFSFQGMEYGYVPHSLQLGVRGVCLASNLFVDELPFCRASSKEPRYNSRGRPAALSGSCRVSLVRSGNVQLRRYEGTPYRLRSRVLFVKPSGSETAVSGSCVV